MKVFTKRPTFIVHRAPIEPGLAEWIEIDVRRTADARLVVFHDETISTGQSVASLPYDALVDLGIPSLDEWLEDLPAEIHVVLDVKNSISDAMSVPGERTGRLAIQAAQRIAQERTVLLTSFDPSIISQASGSLATGLTTWQGVPLRESIPAAAAFGAQVLIAHVNSLRPYGIQLGDSRETLAEYVSIAHQSGLQLACWGATESEITYLTDLGVDAIYVEAHSETK